MQLFHVTLESSLPVILSDGLRPAIGERAQLFGERQPAIYCFDSEKAVEDGLMNWMAEAFEEDETLVILAVDASGLTMEKAPEDFEVRILVPVSADRILAVHDENWRCVWAPGDVPSLPCRDAAKIRSNPPFSKRPRG